MCSCEIEKLEYIFFYAVRDTFDLSLVPEITNCQECRRLDTKEQRDSMEEELARETVHLPDLT